MEFVSLKKHLMNEERLPAYLITGDDAFLIKSAENLFINFNGGDFKDMNISYLFDSPSARKIIETLELLPICADNRLVLVKDFSADATELIEYLKNPNPQSVLVFIEPAFKPNFSKLMSKIEIVDCKKLGREMLLSIIARDASEAESEITKEAANLLIDYTSSDLARINSETAKLSAYKTGGTIVKADVEELVTADEEYKIFALSEAAAQKDSRKAAKILKSLLDAKTPPSSLLSMLYNHFRRLLFVAVSDKSLDLAALFKVKEYAVTVLKRQVGMFSPLRLKKITDEFHKADYDFKSGRTTDILALETVVMEILGGG